MTDRTLVPSVGSSAGVRAQYIGAGSRELTLLSGVEGELAAINAAGQVTVRGHVATVFTPAADTALIRWFEAAQGASCSQYAVFATGLTQGEVDSILQGIR